MNEKIKNIATIMMTFVFLIYFVGIQVNHHLCSTYGKQTTNLFKNAECPCDHNQEITCPYCDTIPKCCNEDQTTNSNQIEFSEPCCIDYSTLFVIDNEFQVNDIENNFHYYAPVEYIISYEKLLNVANKNSNVEFPDPRDKIDKINPIISYIHFSSQSIDEDFHSIS